FSGLEPDTYTTGGAAVVVVVPPAPSFVSALHGAASAREAMTSVAKVMAMNDSLVMNQSPPSGASFAASAPASGTGGVAGNGGSPPSGRRSGAMRARSNCTQLPSTQAFRSCWFVSALHG